MPRKKKQPVIGPVLAAHMYEQVESATTQMLKTLSTYGSEGAIIVFLPSGDQAIFVVSKEETPLSHKKILRKCSALLWPGKFGVDNSEDVT